MAKTKSVKGASPAAKRAAKAKPKADTSTDISAADLEMLEEAAEEAETGDINMEALEAEVEADETKKAGYAKQEAEKAEAPVEAATAKAGRRRNLTGSTPSERLNSAFPEAGDLATALTFHVDDKAIDTAEILSQADHLAKKVGEKFVNTVVNRERSGSMSIFTRIAIKALMDEDSVTSTQLVDLYKNCTENKGKGYGVGTARSQASQMVNLLPALRIATRSGKELSLDKGSLIVEQIQAQAQA